MIAAMLLAQAAAAPGGAAMPYANCLSDRINGDPRMVKLPETSAERIAILDTAKVGCAQVRARVPASEWAMLDRIDQSMRAVMENPQAAEAEHGTTPLDMEDE